MLAKFSRSPEPCNGVAHNDYCGKGRDGTGDVVHNEVVFVEV